MSFRSNILVGVLLNIYLAWDFRMLNDWARWRDTFGNGLGGIEDQFAELEVWLSGAAYLNNHNDGIFAKVGLESSPKIKDLRHPFIPFDRAVRNDFHLTETEQFHIITGPNMAGKSTYLRSVAWAIVCANAGFPVLASSCELPKFSLYTSMRTSDDLSGNSSYFHAELMRLRFIVDAILNGEKVFVILDEILKGTNSKDKEEGSAAFLEKLVRIGGVGIIATHDLSLCRLADRSSAYRNMYFDSTINWQELSFDYKIREGVCKNMNASFLLRKMELID
jgi:DNA mismatch repair ATPase MutS